MARRLVEDLWHRSAAGGSTMMAVVIGVLLAAGGCGADDEAAVPTATELGSSLIATDNLDGDWSVNQGPDGASVPESGVVPEDLRDMLPRLALCDDADADAHATAEALRWQAFRQLDLTTDDPIDPPADRSGHMVFVQEFLLAGEPDEIEAAFDQLRAGNEACLGEIPADQEGPGVAEAMTTPEVGDDRYGVLTTIEESGGWAEWRLHSTIVRRGTVLMSLVVVDILAGDDVEPYFTVEDVGNIVETAVDKL